MESLGERMLCYPMVRLANVIHKEHQTEGLAVPSTDGVGVALYIAIVLSVLIIPKAYQLEQLVEQVSFFLSETKLKFSGDSRVQNFEVVVFRF